MIILPVVQKDSTIDFLTLKQFKGSRYITYQECVYKQVGWPQSATLQKGNLASAREKMDESVTAFSSLFHLYGRLMLGPVCVGGRQLGESERGRKERWEDSKSVCVSMLALCKLTARDPRLGEDKDFSLECKHSVKWRGGQLQSHTDTLKRACRGSRLSGTHFRGCFPS